MDNESKLLSKNIKYLRTAFGETQLDLSLAIEVQANTISQYENGDRIPKPEIKEKIASHYRITVDELIHTDFSNLQIPNFKFANRKQMIQMTLSMFPIIRTEISMKDSLFIRGYKTHLHMVEEMKEGRECADRDYDICLNSYSNSYEKSKTPESLANLMWWFIITEIATKNQWIIDGAEVLTDKDFSINNFYKYFYLKDCDSSEEEHQMEEFDQKELEDFEESIDILLKALKTYAEWSELADYYMAMRYMMGCISNELTEEMNKAIGREMLWAFMKMGNKYAKKLFSLIINNYGK